jgi:hypothetical protein
MGALLSFMGLSFGASLFRFGFFGGNIALSRRLVLLCFSFAAQFVFPGNCAGRLFDPAFHILDDPLRSGFGTSVLALTHLVSFLGRSSVHLTYPGGEVGNGIVRFYEKSSWPLAGAGCTDRTGKARPSRSPDRVMTLRP